MTNKNHMRLAFFCVAFCILLPPVSRAQASADIPTFKIMQEGSTVRFHVKASVAIDGTFGKWDATYVVTSTDASTGVLDIKIQAESVDTGTE